MRSRIVLAACAAAAALGLIALSLPDHEAPRAAVGTEGNDRDSGPSTTDRAMAPEVTDTVVVEVGEAPRATIATAPKQTATSITVPPSSTTSSVAPATTPTTALAPASLRGRIAYNSNTPSATSIWSMLPDGTDRRAEHGCPKVPAWAFSAPFDVSPDGSQLVRSCGGAPSGADAEGYGVVLQDVATGSGRTLLDLDWLGGPGLRFSPDGRRVAVGSITETEIRIVDVATGAVHTVMPSIVTNSAMLTWSPDGRSLLRGDGVVVDVETGEAVDITGAVPPSTSSASAYMARWAPSGSIYIAEMHQVGTGLSRSLWRLLPGGLNAIHVLDDDGFIGWPDFLPDGRVIIELTTIGRVVTMAADGTDQRPIVDAPHSSWLVAPRPVASLPTTG